MLSECVGLAFLSFLIFLALNFLSMAPNARSLAALCREATKHREINSEEAASLVTDPSFVVEHSHVDLLGDLQSGLSLSEMPSGFNASLQHSVFAVAPTAYSPDASSSSPVSLTTENVLANSKQPQFFVNLRLTHGDLDFSPDWEYCEHAHTSMSRHHQIENTDLCSDKPRGMSQQSHQREALNLTKCARAAKVHAQPITNFFAGPSKKRKLDHEPSSVTATASMSEVLATNCVEVEHIASPAPSLHAPSPSYSSPPALSTDIPVLDLNASIGVKSDPCPSDSPVSPVVDESTVTQSDIASGDQPSAVNGVEALEGRQDSDFSAGTPKLRHRELEKLIAEHLKKLRRKRTLLSDTKAASTAFDLEAMRRFNDIWLSLHKKQKKIQPAIQASQQVANLLSKTESYARHLREVAHHLHRTGELPENNQGKGGAHTTLLNRPDIASGVRRFVNGDIPIKEGGFGGRMRPHKLCRYVNKFLLPSLQLEDSISKVTTVRWLTKLGFKLSQVQKGVYVDGHERPDVVEAQRVFIDYMEKEVFPIATPMRAIVWRLQSHRNSSRVKRFITPSSTTNAVCMQMINVAMFGCAKILLLSIWGDWFFRSLFKKNNSNYRSSQLLQHWSQPQQIRPTRQLRLQLPPHLYLLQPVVLLQLRKAKDEAQGQKPPFDARQIIYPGANYDPWWDMPQLLAQTERAIKLLETMYPDGVGVFIFDCSSAHEAYAEDALIAHKMNRGPGGQQPKMHDTVIPGTDVIQSMVYPGDCMKRDGNGESLAGKAKGMEQVLHEQGLLEDLAKMARDKAAKAAKSRQEEADSGIDGISDRYECEAEVQDLDRPSNCCMQHVLSLQPDFKNEKQLLQLVVEKAGHKCLFLPKFHWPSKTA
ncbi:hypothetical protein F5888DRAFT_1806092 [Russula emetica]|nr:hypothetical protein F5888DRAFT_1806092 [Russula emetica]